MMLLNLGIWASSLGGALIRNVQHISITLSGSELSDTATISAVDPDYTAIILEGYSTNSTDGSINDEPKIISRIELTNSTTVTAYRGQQNGSVAVTINAAVVEFNSAVVNKIEHGTMSFVNSNSATATLSSSFDTNTTAIIYLGTTNDNDSGGLNRQCTLELTDSTTITGSARLGSGSSTSLTAGFCAVEFNSSSLQSGVVEFVSIEVSGTSTSATISSVDTSKTFLLWAGVESTSNNENDYPRIYLNSSTQVRAEKSDSSPNAKINAYVIPLNNIGTLQRNTGANVSGTQTDITISSVDTSKTFISYLNQSFSNASNNCGSYFTRISLFDSTTAQLNRGNSTLDTVTVSFEVIGT